MRQDGGTRISPSSEKLRKLRNYGIMEFPVDPEGVRKHVIHPKEGLRARNSEGWKVEPNKGQLRRKEEYKEDRKELGLSSQRPKIKVMKYHHFLYKLCGLNPRGSTKTL